MKKWLSLLLAMLLVLTAFTACNNNADPGTTEPDGTQTQSPTTTDPAGNEGEEQPENQEAVPPEGAAEEQVVKLLYSSEISDWNPLHPSAAGTWAYWIDTLVEYNNYSIITPCLAESWETSEDGLTWTFNIRQGVPWQYYDASEYGADVVAEDWVTSAKWILDPANGAGTADLLFDVVGAEEYYNALLNGETADWSTVGIRATDTYVLEYELEAPCPYFLSRLTYNWGYPTNAQYLEEMGETFGTNYDTILYCGEFTCTQYEPYSYMISERNPLYWDLANIHIERIEERYNQEAGTLAPEALLRGEVTYADIPTDQIDGWLNDPAKADLIRPSRPGSGSNYTYFFLINFMPTYTEGTRNIDGVDYELSHDQWLAAANNMNFRKALYYGLDRVKAIGCYDPYTPELYVQNTITPPNFCETNGVDYTELEALTDYTHTDQFQSDKALEYRDKAKEELTAAGVSLPIVAYMPYVVDSATQTNLAVVVSQQLEELLGSDFIKFVLEGYPDTDYLRSTRRVGNYSFMMSYWGPDYADPETWTDPFNFGQAYNYIWRAEGYAEPATEGEEGAMLGRTEFDETYWKNFDYYDMVEEACAEVIDLEKRYNAIAETEAWLLDNAFVIPIGRLEDTGYVSSCTNPFESQYAPFGLSNGRYKYQWVYEKPMNTEEYEAALAKWEEERAALMANAE